MFIYFFQINHLYNIMDRQRRRTPLYLGRKYEKQIRKYLNDISTHNLPKEIVEIVERYQRKAKAKINSSDSYQDKTVCVNRRRQPDVVYYGQLIVVIIDWKYSDKDTDHRHQMWRYAKLYQRYGNNCHIWVVSIKNGQILQKFKAQNLINKMEAWCLRVLLPHLQQLHRIRRRARETGRSISNHPWPQYRNMTWNALYLDHPDQVGYYILTRRNNYEAVSIFYALKKTGLYDEGQF